MIEIYKNPQSEEYAVFGKAFPFRINDKGHLISIVISEMTDYIKGNWLLLSRKEYDKTRETVLNYFQLNLKLS